MAITLSTGVQIQVAKTYAAAVPFTTISSASEAVVTVANTLANGDYVEVSSGWGLIDKRIFRVKAVSGSSFTLEGANTTGTKFPAGTGAGSFRKVTAWTEITQVKSISTSGGEQQFADVTAINDVVSRQVPTTRGAVNVTLEVYDDPTQAYFPDVIAADESRTPYGLYMIFANGSKTLANAYWSISRVPNIATNEAMTASISLSFAAEPVRYAA